MQVINWPLARHPMNWLTIWLMLFIAGIALHLTMQAMGIQSPKNSSPVAPSGTPTTNQNVPGNL